MVRHLTIARLLVVLAGLFPAGLCPAGAVTFAAKPTATKAGDGFKIEFALSAPADVEVAVLNAAGDVVRHLAAGVLGAGNLPPEPLQAGLAQSLQWDNKDDFGKPAIGGPFTVRVAAGLNPQFDGFLLYNPEAGGSVDALATGPNGNLYVFQHDPTALLSHWGCDKVSVLTRDGKYVRALTPFPADIAPEKIKALTPFTDEAGDIVPHIQHVRRLSFYPEPSETIACFTTPAVDSRGRVYWLTVGPSLVCVDAEGGVPYDAFMGPKLLPDIKNLCSSWTSQAWNLERHTHLLVSGDDKYIYLAGLGTWKNDQKERVPLPCVFRIDSATRGPAEVFLGKLDAPGNDKDALTNPSGLALAGGLLYVTDSASDRVVVFKESDRSYVGQISVKGAQSLAVDPATGAVYVCAFGDPAKGTADLIKFENITTGKELYRLPLPRTNHTPADGIHRMAMDATAKPVRIWLPAIPGTGSELKCIEDSGDKFLDKGDLRNLKEPWAEGPRDLTLDRARGELYVKSSNQKWFRIEEKTGKTMGVVDLNKIHKYGLYSGDRGTQMVPGPDGSLVTMSWNSGLVHLDRDGKPSPWPGRDIDCIPYGGGLMNFMLRCLAVPTDDELYVIMPNNYRLKDDKEKANVKTRMHSVDVLGTDGAAKRTVIWQCTHGAILRVDHRGNIYLAEPLKPLGRLTPEFFDGKIAPLPRSMTPGEGKDSFWYSYMYGSIVKFPPSGGVIWYDKDKTLSPSVVGQPPPELLAQPSLKFQAHLVYTPNAPAEVKGAQWVRFGFSPFAMHNGSDTCMCEGAGFDIDLYGRVFYPNLGQFRIEAVDAANNMIGSFGKYGNRDSGGKDALVKKPAIPLAWPLSVVASDTHAYIADTVSRRVVRVKLAHAAEETCPVP